MLKLIKALTEEKLVCHNEHRKEMIQLVSSNPYPSGKEFCINKKNFIWIPHHIQKKKNEIEFKNFNSYKEIESRT